MRERNPAEKRDRLLAAGLAQAHKVGYAAITRDAVARAARVGAGTLNQLFTDIAGLRQEVLLHAVRSECLPVIAQGLAAKDPIARAAPDELQKRALDSIAQA